MWVHAWSLGRVMQAAVQPSNSAASLIRDTSSTPHLESTMDVPSPATSALSALPISARDLAELLGRVLLSVLFLLSGVGKVGAYSATAAYMASVGLPSSLLPIVIAIEVFGALAIIAGWQTRVVAFLLAAFSLLTAAIFHRNFSDQIQMITFLKNGSIAGGWLLLVAHGAGPLSLDRYLSTRRKRMTLR